MRKKQKSDDTTLGQREKSILKFGKFDLMQIYSKILTSHKIQSFVAKSIKKFSNLKMTL